MHWSAAELYTTGIAYTPIVNIAVAVERDVWLKGLVIDYFSPEFRGAADRVVARTCAPHAQEPWLLGYFTDNELRWGSDSRSKESLRGNISVAVDGEVYPMGLLEKVDENSEIHFVVAIRGG